MNTILPFLRSNPAGDSSFDLSDVIHAIHEAWEQPCFRRGVDLDVDVPPYTMLHGDRGQFRAALELLIGQAVEVTPRGGGLVLTVYGDDRVVEVELADSGQGLADLFAAPGLAAMDNRREQRRIKANTELRHRVLALGGRLELQDCPDGGTAITISFAQYQQRAAA
jgi:K+-sensing histidine kinase KdpD